VPGLTEINALDALLARIYTGAVFTTGATWLSICPTGTTLIDATYYVLNGSATPYVINHAAAGAGGAGTVPSEVAQVLTLRTGVRGRRSRGRMYLPAWGSVSLAAGGNLIATAITNFLTQVNGVNTALATPLWELGVASYGSSWNRGPHNPHGAATLSSWTPFFTPVAVPPGQPFTMDAKPDVQRRRK
jgi:hypothetical protein